MLPIEIGNFSCKEWKKTSRGTNVRALVVGRKGEKRSETIRKMKCARCLWKGGSCDKLRPEAYVFFYIFPLTPGEYTNKIN